MQAARLLERLAWPAATLACLSVGFSSICLAAPLPAADADSLAAPPSTVGTNSPTGTLSIADADPPVSPPSAADANISTTIVMLLEAESYAWSFDAGGRRIYKSSSCKSGASGGKDVEGVDYPGDFIELNVTLREPLLARHSLASSEDVGVRSMFVIQYLPPGGHGAPGPADTLVTSPGRGVG